MSAFQVSSEHIGSIVRWYLYDTHDYERGLWAGSRPTPHDGESLSKILADECFKSVRYRYPDGPLPGPTEFPDSAVKVQQPVRDYRELSPIEVIKLCHSLAYQSCEHPGWGTSEAKQILDHIESVAVQHIPGYQEAAWTI